MPARRLACCASSWLAPLRLQQASAQLEKPARLRTLRKDIARVETRISALRNQVAK